MMRVEILCGDGIEFLRDHCLKMPTHSLVYIDPPYVTNGYKLYRYHFEKAQHAQLSEAVSGLCVPWLMSYDNHPLIRDLYICLLYTSPSPRDRQKSRMPSSA